MENLMDAAQPVSQLSAEGKAARKKMLTAISTAIVTFLQTKMTITILPAQAGLQTTTSPAAPTGPPPVPMPLLPGSIT
jgi:hypothetical protein